MIGKSDQYADMRFGCGVEEPPSPPLVSTNKLWQAGFADCVDTEEMFRAALTQRATAKVIPLPPQ